MELTGYMSPQCALEDLFSVKCDVFTFGVLPLEIVSGKKNTGFYHTDSLNILGHAWDKDGRALDLMDPTLENETSYPVLLRYINMALFCVKEVAAERPTMSEVVSMLTNELAAYLLPTSLFPSTSRSEACSVNETIITVMEA